MGVLYVVSTPIGHLGDVTLRAIETLRSVAMVACEDTRVTRRLMAHHGIATRLVSYHAHSRPEAADRLLAALDEGQDIALVSDAGTPLLSDPGLTLVQGALDRGLPVVPVPGPSAILSALVVSGLPTQPFLFVGFLPRENGPRREALAGWVDAEHTTVAFEAPSRLFDALSAIESVFADRPLAVARELTKKFEQVERGPARLIAERFERPVRGELVLVIGPAPARPTVTGADECAVPLEDARRLLLGGVAPTQAARVLAGAHGLSKKQAYALVLRARSAPNPE